MASAVVKELRKKSDAAAANLVQLRYFAGLTLPEAAQGLGISPSTASRLWAYARAWLRREIEGTPSPLPLSPSEGERGGGEGGAAENLSDS